ncbi:hypothetical protein SSX86_027260 [Deinandra increscens subsp. villosa]|uniref:Mesoderm development candidate 2 n=1 Tax=Deinandra increscens subsp. villosa TaxID=3103831 RepID=A0AAP0CGE2_9ASTR
MTVHSRLAMVEVTVGVALFSPANFRLLFFVLLLIVSGNSVVAGTKKRVHIPDDLHDVEDNEEDEAWIEWGQRKKMTKEEFDPPPENFSDMDIAQMREEIMKRQVGQSYGFVKLRLTDHRTPEMISDIAEKWTNLARTGAIGITFMGFDISTVMFSLENVQNTNEVSSLQFLITVNATGYNHHEHTLTCVILVTTKLIFVCVQVKEFVLSQPESYEIKMGDRFFRRPGDPPYDKLLKELHKSKKKQATSSNDTMMKTEL